MMALISPSLANTLQFQKSPLPPQKSIKLVTSLILSVTVLSNSKHILPWINSTCSVAKSLSIGLPFKLNRTEQFPIYHYILKMVVVGGVQGDTSYPVLGVELILH